eukprot:TRINITY_DN11578_c0_g2_i1.p1 TRINITY_DN11578_c0_g2~~TRINITY_DN11578_c0_g2_i1.p1  ORF type:complete len:341 (+),score=69.62 TRINITY_DN11578_c0_g2_i1:78-1025(+)
MTFTPSLPFYSNFSRIDVKDCEEFEVFDIMIEEEPDFIETASFLSSLMEEEKFFLTSFNSLVRPSHKRKVYKNLSHISSHQLKKLEKRQTRVDSNVEEPGLVLCTPVENLSPYELRAVLTKREKTKPKKPNSASNSPAPVTKKRNDSPAPVPRKPSIHAKREKSPKKPTSISNNSPTPEIHPVSSSPSSTSHGFETDLQMVLQMSRNDKHESGLSYSELFDLFNREITPEDYDLLLLLDTTVAKKTVHVNTITALEESVVTEDDTGDCIICFVSFEKGDRRTKLPCNHLYHTDCITVWLRDHSRSCPLCKAVVGS